MLEDKVKPRAKVAVITRTKDRSEFLKRAINSVLSQTFEDWLHVIVNDGGNSKTVDFLVQSEAKAYNGRALVIHHPESAGMQNASNKGLLSSDSDYVVIHDDDDSWESEFLAQTVGILENESEGTQVRAVVTQSNQIFEEVLLNGSIVEVNRQKYMPFDVVTLEAMLKGNLYPPIALLYRRDTHDKIGFFSQEFDVLGDYDFNLRLLRHYDILVIEEAYANYHWRQHSYGNSVTRRRSVHRQMLAKLKNAYARDVISHSPEAIGFLNDVPMPQDEAPAQIHFKCRDNEPRFEYQLPNFEAIFDFEVLSIDIFDTVLFRRTYQPTDVFKILELETVEQFNLLPQPLALARKKAEDIARKDFKGGEVTIEEIYLILGNLLGLDSAELTKLQALEWSLEKKILYADSRWVELYQRYQKLGKKVVFISDMYWPKSNLVELLSDLGFKRPKVFVSCDYKVSKHSGGLQLAAIEELGLEPSKILHVGDNYRSDFARSKMAGMQSFHWCDPYIYKPLAEQVELPPLLSEDIFSLRLIGEARYMELAKPLDSSPDLLMERLGREIAGPLYYCFLSWAVRMARSDGVRHLFFLGRDGYYWKKTMKFLDDNHSLGMKFTYLETSRKVMAFASFRELDERALEFLSDPNPSLKVCDFIDRIGLDSGKYAEEIHSVGFSSPDVVLTSELGGSFLRSHYKTRLCSLFRLIELDLLECFGRCRDGLLYTLNEYSFDTKDCAIVDIGWQGTSANALAHFLELSDPNSLRAYYFGTWEQIRKVLPAINYRSFFVNEGEPKEFALLLLESVNLFEVLHSAPFATMLDYKLESKNVYSPVFSTYNEGGLSRKEHSFLWHGVEFFLKTVADSTFPLEHNNAGINYLQLVLHRIMREPSPSERSRLGAILHSEGLGNEVNKPLIMPLVKKSNQKELIKKYWASNWKRGYLAELQQGQREIVWARIARNENPPFCNGMKIPWHKYIYRLYRRILGDPKYAKVRIK